jgi:hypothetical protein
MSTRRTPSPTPFLVSVFWSLCPASRAPRTPTYESCAQDMRAPPNGGLHHRLLLCTASLAPLLPVVCLVCAGGMQSTIGWSGAWDAVHRIGWCTASHAPLHPMVDCIPPNRTSTPKYKHSNIQTHAHTTCRTNTRPDAPTHDGTHTPHTLRRAYALGLRLKTRPTL